MPKEFYTQKDIEDMFKRGVMSLQVSENVVLTELAYEKANRLGMQLLRDQADNPPSAPVRPYLSQKQSGRSVSASDPAAVPSAFSPLPTPPVQQGETDLAKCIREAVVARLGSQVDSTLLDVIIQRVLKATGVK